MTSHLPEPVLAMLRSMTVALDGGLQSDTHKVSQALAADDAFQQTYVESTLTRALICRLVRSMSGIESEELPNGGCEIQHWDDGVERRFRLKRSTRDNEGRLVVTVSSDSILTGQARARGRGLAPTLFEMGDPEPALPQGPELWVLPYLIDPRSRTLIEMSVALPIGLLHNQPPFKLILDNIVRLPLSAPTPPSFPRSDDDLDLGDQTEGDRGTETG